MHKLLARQLQRHWPGDAPPKEMRALLEAISAAYYEIDEERYLLDHCLEQATEELYKSNATLQQKLAQLSRVHSDLARYASLLGGYSRPRAKQCSHLMYRVIY